MNMNERDVFHISEWKFVVGMVVCGAVGHFEVVLSFLSFSIFLDLSRDSIVLPGIFFTVYSSGSTARAVFPASINAANTTVNSCLTLPDSPANVPRLC
jgi:6,7-dimethyl-8-ribityllumazine synthase